MLIVKFSYMFLKVNYGGVMKRFILIVIILCFCKPVYADWSQDKTARELFFAVTLYKDWMQTLEIARSPWRREKNKILGSRPHRDNVNIYMGGCLISHALITYMLPDEYARIWQDVWIGIESDVSDGNVLKGHEEYAHIGYRITHTIEF